MINVKDSQFGAIGNGQTDDTIAIQNAVNYAKSLTAPGGGAYKATIYFPAGFYYISAPINVTNAIGIWLVGDGGLHLNTGIIGNTSGAMFDFSGSSLSGCENFFFLSSTGFGLTRSTIGVQFALTSSGGLNCGIRHCSFQMEDFETANNGLGTIGILNIRSEEFYIHECLVRANTSIIMSNGVSLSPIGVNFTATSSYQTLSAGVGSMGVVNIQSTSLQNYEKRQPALILNGTNSVNFQGFISRLTSTNGTNETAIFCGQNTTNFRIHTTIESFSRIMVATGGFYSNDLNVVIANSVAPTTDLINLTGCLVKGLQLRISLPNISERNNRYVVYYAPDSNPNQQAGGVLMNSEITCYDIISNQYIITPNFLKRAVNVLFNTQQPFEKRGGRIRQLSNNSINAGTVGSVSSLTVFSFTQADNIASPNGRGGYYRILLDGVIRGGSYGSGGSAVVSFEAQILINQNNVGTMDLPSITVIMLDRSVTNPSYIDIIGVLVNISFNNRIGTVTVTPRAIGGGIGEPLSYDGTAEIQSDFLINDPIPI